MKNWKYPFLLLAGIGVSYLGNWIYLIAINLSILDLTGSAAAVAGLYVIRPIAILITNTWSGSVIDRTNKRKLMIGVDVIRGLLVFLIPFIGSLWVIYFLLLLINIVGAFFGPSSSVYITKLIPASDRKRFNSLMSMTSSGAFLLGPALTGVLIMLVGTELCIFINAATFLVCAFFIYLLPDVDDFVKEKRDPITWSMLVGDWRIVRQFAVGATFFMTVYLLFQGAMLTGFALDSQEVTFIKQHLLLTDQEYGWIVSLTGLGALGGAGVAAIVANRVSLRFYIGGGMLLTSLGYLLFYSSIGFWTATLSFVFLGFFMAFANTGYATFFQQSVPVEIMGRFGSIAEMLQAIVQIVLTLILGVAADWFTIQTACIAFCSVGVVLAAVLFITVLLPSKQVHFSEGKLEA
ncbi:MFS family permease [Bacillus tianshenii]|uniref:MFS family permease n=1 Tax=Sutcliffiella tianshenii TaxID=1463404 RepID=A0ABS2P4P5_9BACI|nr:MFS transporter [Bacillus tianshenii]MBM7621931.1 MFS family permease [Bacillus tianshenii]